MKKAFMFITALICAFILTGCNSHAVLDADKAVEELEGHLISISHVGSGLQGAAGEKLAWAKEDIEEIKIHNNDCYMITLRFADEPENGVMAGRRYATYGVSKDGFHFYIENPGAETEEELWDKI